MLRIVRIQVELCFGDEVPPENVTLFQPGGHEVPGLQQGAPAEQEEEGGSQPWESGEGGILPP